MSTDGMMETGCTLCLLPCFLREMVGFFFLGGGWGAVRGWFAGVWRVTNIYNLVCMITIIGVLWYHVPLKFIKNQIIYYRHHNMYFLAPYIIWRYLGDKHQNSRGHEHDIGHLSKLNGALPITFISFHGHTNNH